MNAACNLLQHDHFANHLRLVKNAIRKISYTINSEIFKKILVLDIYGTILYKTNDHDSN